MECSCLTRHSGYIHHGVPQVPCTTDTCSQAPATTVRIEDYSDPNSSTPKIQWLIVSIAPKRLYRGKVFPLSAHQPPPRRDCGEPMGCHGSQGV